MLRKCILNDSQFSFFGIEMEHLKAFCFHVMSMHFNCMRDLSRFVGLWKGMKWLWDWRVLQFFLLDFEDSNTWVKNENKSFCEWGWVCVQRNLFDFSIWRKYLKFSPKYTNKFYFRNLINYSQLTKFKLKKFSPTKNRLKIPNKNLILARLH